jgi:CRP-like cAMP-binding protein
MRLRFLTIRAALSNTPYEITAELLDNSQVVFVRRKNLMKFLREHRSARLRIVHILSQDLHMAYERVRTVGAIRTHHPRMVPARVPCWSEFHYLPLLAN